MANAKGQELIAIVNSDYVKQRFSEVMGERSAAFLASILNATRTNPALKDCTPQSVIASAMVAATLDLPIDGSLGFSALVPYKNKGVMEAQFQIMTKGFVQLALRTGQYKAIHVGPVYADEYHGENPITGEVDIRPVAGGIREKNDESLAVGYVCYFRLVNGYECTRFWPMSRILAHGKKYSKSFASEYGMWQNNLPAMAAKTVLKNTLSRWGILSTTMQMAVKFDQAVARDYSKGPAEIEAAYVDSTEGEDAAPDTRDPEDILSPPPADPADMAKPTETKPAAKPSKLAEIKLALIDYGDFEDTPQAVKDEIDKALKATPDDPIILGALLAKVKSAVDKR